MNDEGKAFPWIPDISLPSYLNLGYLSPLGHTYSVLTEAFHDEGIVHENTMDSFLEFMKSDYLRQGDYMAAAKITSSSPTLFPYVMLDVMQFAHHYGLSKEKMQVVGQQIYGTQGIKEIDEMLFLSKYN